MGKMKENPRYHILSLRVTDDELRQVRAAIGPRGTVQALLLLALQEKLETLQRAGRRDC